MVQTQPEPLRKIVEPSTRLMWPELQDDHLENSRKAPLDRHDIIIDKVSRDTLDTHDDIDWSQSSRRTKLCCFIGFTSLLLFT